MILKKNDSGRECEGKVAGEDVPGYCSPPARRRRYNVVIIELCRFREELA